MKIINKYIPSVLITTVAAEYCCTRDGNRSRIKISCRLTVTIIIIVHNIRNIIRIYIYIYMLLSSFEY